MTAEAVSATVTPLQERLAELFGTLAEADKRLRQAICAELAEKLPEYEKAEADAAAALEKAYAAARGPERDDADLDAEIARNESERAEWLVQLEVGDVRDRVEARRWVEEYDNELAGLRERKDFATAQLLPLRDAVTKAKGALEAATARLRGAELNATPPLAYFGAGQKTAAYTMRFGFALEPALRDPAHPEHDAAVDHMLHLCTVSGFRTEDYADRLPSDARAAARFWDQQYENANPPQPAPSGREIVDQLNTSMAVQGVNAAMGPSKVDDWRGPGPRKHVPPSGAVPVPDKPWLKVPR